MFRSFLKIALRSILKYRVYSGISILGLSIGFCAYMLISLYVDYEYSWDRYNDKYARIYRIQRTNTKAVLSTNGNNISPHTRGITAKLIDGKYPEIEKTLLLREERGNYFSSDTKNNFWEESGFSSDQTVFDVFTFHFIAGYRENSLKDPFTIIISESLADKLFPDELAVGKTIVLEKKYSLKITGVYVDFPFNSSFRPNYITSLSSYDQFEDNKTSLKSDYFTFVLLKDGQSPFSVEKKISGLFKGFKDFEAEELSLCPLSRVYLSFNGNRDYLVILLIYKMIGIFILLLSAFNCINLTTAHSSVRNKEIAVKKIFGSDRLKLVLQFMAETVITAFISICIALILTRYTLPLFNAIIAKNLELFVATQWPFILKMTGIALLVGLMSGLYPAVFMSGKPALDLFKGNLYRTSNDRSVIRKVLIVLQFSIAVLFIILTLNFYLQLRYTLHKDIGFNRKDLLYTTISVTREDADWELLRSRILRHAGIESASMSRYFPLITFGGHMTTWEGAPPDEVVFARDNRVSYDYVQTLGMQISKGRDFSRSFPSDRGTACIINESAARAFSWDNPIGKKIDGRYRVIGVVRDFHNNDMYNKIEPFFMVLNPDTTMKGVWSLAFRVDPKYRSDVSEIIQSELEEYLPSDPFELKDYEASFNDEKIISIYRTIQNLVFFFTCLTILIAIFGLLGLVSFTIQRRTKEIGIRKIHGSSGMNIFVRLSTQYIILLAFASCFAWPAAFILFLKTPGTYKFGFQLWPYLVATFLVMAIIFLTASFHMIRAANANPVDTLRYE